MAAPGEEERLAPGRGVAGLAILATGVISARLARHPELMGWTLGDTIAPISAGTLAVTACAAAWLTGGRARSIAGLAAAGAVALALGGRWRRRLDTGSGPAHSSTRSGAGAEAARGVGSARAHGPPPAAASARGGSLPLSALRLPRKR